MKLTKEIITAGALAALFCAVCAGVASFFLAKNMSPEAPIASTPAPAAAYSAPPAAGSQIPAWRTPAR